MDLRSLLLKLAHRVAVSHGPQVSPSRGINVLAEETHGTVGHRDMNPAFMETGGGEPPPNAVDPGPGMGTMGELQAAAVRYLRDIR